jgi:steroid delta-isomerase-like uncharacterized protein
MTATPASDLRTLAQRFADEVINAQNLDDPLTELVADDFVELNPLPGQGQGRAGLAEVLTAMFTGFPDLHWKVLDSVVEGDRVVSISTWTGTHLGDYMGMPATGRRVSVETWTIDHFRDGQMIDSRLIMDAAGMLAQLGALPPPPGS